MLPETFAVGFSMATDRVAEPADGPTARWLGDQAAAHGIWIGGSVPERAEGERRCRTTCSCSPVPAGERHRYAKRHLFTYGSEHEALRGRRRRPSPSRSATSGAAWPSATTSASATSSGRQAPTTDCYLVVANWPTPAPRPLAGPAPGPGHREPGLRRGREPGRAPRATAPRHSGGSCILAPRGEVLADAGEGEEILVADVDPEVVAATRERFPFIADRTFGGA